jgi:hypothetical protein
MAGLDPANQTFKHLRMESLGHRLKAGDGEIENYSD